MRWLRLLLVATVAVAVAVGSYVAAAPYPRLRAARLVTAWILTPIQRLLLRDPPLDPSAQFGFAFEDPAALRPLRDAYRLDTVVGDAANDFEATVRLMHWVRDQFPHGTPATPPDPHAFDGLALLQSYAGGGYHCSTATQLLVQAITAVGGCARRVDLRFTPADEHVVAEAWSRHYDKWIVLDSDSDLYFTVDGVPQSALELHRHWAADRIDDVTVHWRESPHNIYRPADEQGDRSFIRAIYDARDWARWDAERARHRRDKFSVKLLNYYTHLAYSLRNDWLTRRLPWWHPLANHVQGSVTLALPTMPDAEDFAHRLPSPDPLYATPVRKEH